MNRSFSVLSDKQIVEEREAGNIIIEPFNLSQINNTSYDVTLGEWFYSPSPEAKQLDIFNQENINTFWGAPQKADTEIILQPNTTYLCHTREFIGGVKRYTTMMKAKSSLGRCGISVCLCAGWGDVGYFNRWTMEVKNHCSVPVTLKVGMKIAQIVFFSTDDRAFDYSINGNYQKSSDLETLRKNWNPESMIPKALKNP